MNSNSGKKKGNYLFTAVVLTAVALAIFSIATPNFLRSRIAANEASAVGSVRTINSALASYTAEHPEQGYPPKLADLVPNIDSVLAEGQKSGYRFTYVPQIANVDGVVRAFRVDAVPLTAETGQRRFSSDESGVIRYRASLAQPERALDGGPSEPAPMRPVPAVGKRRTIQTASLNLIVSDPAATAEKIRALAQRFGGYVDAVRSSDDGAGTQQTSIQIRVPADRFEEARREIRALAKRVKDEEGDARDVSAQHVDMESHLRNYRAEEEQYLGIMHRSGKIKDTLAVAERLADVRGRIEQTQGSLDQLSHQAEMALLAVSLQTEAAPAQPIDVHWHPIAEVKAAFWSAADDLSTYANFMIAVFFRLPVFALWALTLTLSALGVWRALCWTWKMFGPRPSPAA